MVAMVSLNPELTKSMPPDSGGAAYTRSSSVYSPRADSPAPNSRHTPTASISSRRSVYGGVAGGDAVSESVSEVLNGDDEIPVGHHFTFIPPNPKRFYKRLVEYCLVADLELMFSPEVDDADEVPLTVLSPPHVELINECALRWRIGQSHRATCFLELIKQLYERGDVPMECIPEALQAVSKVQHDLEIDKWSIQDVSPILLSLRCSLLFFSIQSELLANVYGGLYNVFLASLYHSLDSLPNTKVSEIQPYLSVLDHIRESGLIGRFEDDVNNRLSELEEHVQDIAAQHYHDKMRQLQSAPGVNRALPLLLMTDELEKAAKQLDKRFSEPLVGCVVFLRVYLLRLLIVVKSDRPGFFGSSSAGPLIYHRLAEISQETPRIVY